MHACVRACARVRVCVFWVGGGELLICGAVRRREVVFQTRYGGSAVERKTFLILGILTRMLTGEDIVEGDIGFFHIVLQLCFPPVLFVFKDVLHACEWTKFNFLTKTDSHHWPTLSWAAVSWKLCRSLIYLWDKPVLLLLQSTGLASLQTEPNWLQAKEKPWVFFFLLLLFPGDFIPSSLISSSLSLSLLCAPWRRRSPEPKKKTNCDVVIKTCRKKP